MHAAGRAVRARRGRERLRALRGAPLKGASTCARKRARSTRRTRARRARPRSWRCSLRSGGKGLALRCASLRARAPAGLAPRWRSSRVSSAIARRNLVPAGDEHGRPAPRRYAPPRGYSSGDVVRGHGRRVGGFVQSARSNQSRASGRRRCSGPFGSRRFSVSLPLLLDSSPWWAPR